MKVDARGLWYTLTVVRGIRGSTAVAHGNGTAIFEKQGYRAPLPWEVWSGTVTTTINDADGITAADTTITVVSTTNFAAPGMVRIDNEDITYSGKTATTLIGCTRGVNGTTAATHANAATVTNQTLRRQMLATLQHIKDTGYDADPYVSAITIFAGTKVEEIILNDDENADADYAGGHNTWTYGGYTQAKHEAAVKQCVDDYHRIFTISPLLLALNHIPFVSDGVDAAGGAGGDGRGHAGGAHGVLQARVLRCGRAGRSDLGRRAGDPVPSRHYGAAQEATPD